MFEDLSETVDRVDRLQNVSKGIVPELSGLVETTCRIVQVANFVKILYLTERILASLIVLQCSEYLSVLSDQLL